jgi:hypothetical protein
MTFTTSLRSAADPIRRFSDEFASSGLPLPNRGQADGLVARAAQGVHSCFGSRVWDLNARP